MTAPISTLIVDDEPSAREALALLLAADPEVAVIGEATDGVDALARIRRDRPALVFLDIQMPALDGLALLGQLHGEELPAVVFVTAYDRHALAAFDLHAVDYLLKPFDDERFHRALSRAKQRVRQGELGALAGPLQALLAAARPPRWRERLVVRAEGRNLVVPVAEIDWIEAKGDYLQLHAGSVRHLLRGTLKALEAELDPAVFVRIHRSVLVRIERIREWQPYFHGDFVVILTDGTRLRLARGCRERLEQALGRTLQSERRR